MPSSLHRVPFHRQRGAAALLVVVVLFFILAMVTAYAGRNLIFEQRTSVNNQRAAQAFEAAESGIDFAVSLLGGGRVDAACLPTTDVTQTTLRQRMMTQDAIGNFTVTGAPSPTCMLLNAGANCSCPATGLPSLAPPVGLLAPTFKLEFIGGIGYPGIVQVDSTGCSSIGSQCYTDASVTAEADAVAKVSVLLGLNSALATLPSTPLTVRGNLNLNGGAISVINTDVPSRGVTIDAGGPVTNSANARLTSVPGTPGATSVIESDTSLSTLTPDRLFVSLFGIDRATYRTQPAAVRLTCAGDCTTAIAAAVSDNPGRIIWVQGPTTIGANQVLGSAATPVMLFVQGDLTVNANLQMHGVLYLHSTSGQVNWVTTAGSTVIHGAVVAEGNLATQGAPGIVFDPNVLRTINLTQGSMVRVPGSWRDFAQGS